MTRVQLNRRRFLKLVGASAFTYPFLRGVPSFAAGNNGGTNPINLVLLFTSCGTVRYLWGAQGPAPAPPLTATSTAVTNGPLVFRQRLSPFASAGANGQAADLTKYITVLDGLSNRAAGGGTHESGMASLWTGLPSTGNAATGPSIDQVISSVLPKATFPNVGLLVQSAPDFDSANVDSRMLYSLTGGYVNPNTTPAEAVATLFPSAMLSADAGPDKKAIIRKAVTDHINADLTSLQARLCTEDRVQMQNLQALWNSVIGSLNAAAAASQSCMTPAATASGLDAGTTCMPPFDPFYAYSQVMPNILTLTLACGLTNVASLQYSQAHSATTHCWLGSQQTDTHHNYSHTGPTYLGALGPDLYNEPASVATASYQPSGVYAQQLVDIETWYSQQIANMAYSMTQFGPSGSTLLDNTVICWGSEIDMGFAHNHDDTPFVLIGGAGGKLKSTQVGGQLVRFPLVNLGNSVTQNGAGLRFHNDLLLTLAQIMGVSQAQVQAAYGSNWSAFSQFASGPITEILT